MASSTLPPLIQRFSLLKAAYVASLVAADAIMVRLAFVLAYRLRQVGDPAAVERMRPLAGYDDLALLFTVLVLAVFAVRRMYIPQRGVSRVDLLYQVGGSVTLGWVACLAISVMLYRAIDPPRMMLVYWGILSIALVWIGRLLLNAVLRDAHRRGRDLERVLIVGDGDDAEIVWTKIRQAPEIGFHVVGFIGNGGSHAGVSRVGPILGGIDDVAEVVRQHAIGEVVIASPGVSHTQLVDIVTSCTREHVNIKIFPDIFDLMAREVETSELTGLPLMRVRDVALSGWSRLVKRAVDVSASWALLVVLSPVLLMVALFVKLTSPNGPVLFVQERVGLDGRSFPMIKFRSMQPDAEADTGPIWAQPGDARRTPLGAFMRRFSIDEMPQLVNVLLGEMSLVGPRPERPEFVAQFERFVPRYQERHREKSGLTGWAQVNGLRGQTSIEERTKYDLFYVENWSLAFDFKILLKTIGTVLGDRNAY